jgi:hypothetical protein
MSGKMSKIQGMDCSGNDLIYYKVGTNGINSESDCHNKCLKTDGCNATAYSPFKDSGGNQYCWLKTKADNFSINKNRNCSYKNNRMVHLPGLDLYGNDIKSFSHTSPEQCISYCQNNVDCTAIVHAPKENYCWLKNTYKKNKNYRINSDRDGLILNSLDYNASKYGSEQYTENEADYATYMQELGYFNDAKLVKSVMQRNQARLGDMQADSTLKSNALEVHKQKLMRQTQQEQTQQRATADSNNMNKQLSSAYDQLIDDNIDGINKLDRAIENKRYLINENNKGASEKNKSIYILSYFLLLMLLIAVIFLCTFLEIISSRITMGLTVIATLFFIFKVVHKYYWDRVDTEAVALKKMVYTGYKDMGEDIRDAVLPKWVYSCPKRCKSKKPDHMKPHPGSGKLYTDAPDLKTDSSENVWAKDIKSPTTYNCQWQGSPEEMEVSKQCISGSTIPCDEYLGYKEVESCSA